MPLDMRYQGTQYTTTPDFTGKYGKAWRVHMPPVGQRGRPDVDASIDMFIVQRRGAHVLWDHWGVTMIHLRPIEGCRPPHITVPGATHELMIVALNPEKPLPPLNSAAPDFAPAYLTPIDIAQQFICPDDAFAQHLLELSVDAIIAGYISPDEDARRDWQASIATTLEHYQDGTHTRRRPS